MENKRRYEGLPIQYEEFKEHIEDETQKARLKVTNWIDDPYVTSVGCVDELTKKGVVNPPGGLIFLYAESSVGEENLLERFVRTRAQAAVKNGVLMAHLNCGYMRVVLGQDELPSHVNTIRQAVASLNDLNANYDTNFKVILERQGSATPYMKKG